MTTARTSPDEPPPTDDDTGGGGMRERAQPSQPSAPSGQGKLSDHLANQRTLLAWARTGVSIMALGFVVARFGLLIRELSAAHATPRALPTGVADGFGIALILFGAALVGLSLARYLRIGRGIDAGDVRVTPTLDIAMTVGLILAGVILAVYLALTG